MTKKQLIEAPLNKKQVVLLGAGASRAAFGKAVPVMDDLIDVLELRPLIVGAGLELVGDEKNFEVIYGLLKSDPKYESTTTEIENRVHEFFSGLSLPDKATIYDRLLISLRPTDAVFTFNWDPFLFDAYCRNVDTVALPEIFFLHGNVRIGACRDDDSWGPRCGICPTCSRMFDEVPLIYPIRQKNYSDNPYIHGNWEAARILFGDGFTLTIFGYGAPASDVDAVRLLRGAWVNENTPRAFEHIEIIDVAPESLLSDRWSAFTPTHHYHVTKTFENSHIARWPRRSCESWFYPMSLGSPCEDFPLPMTDDLTKLQTYTASIAQYEKNKS